MKTIRFATEKLTSVENDLLEYEVGYGYLDTVVQADEVGTVFLPTNLDKVEAVLLTPSGTFPVYLLSKEPISAVDNLVAWASNKGYFEGQLVKYDNTPYICIEEHTSGATFDSSKWKKVQDKFIAVKVKNNSIIAYNPTSGLFKVNYLVVGYRG